MKKIVKKHIKDEGGTAKLFSCRLGILVFLLLNILLIGITSCTVRYYPQPSDHITVIDGYAVMQVDGLSMAIMPRAWAREPQRVNDYFTTYYMVVINQTSNTITVSPEDISLLDDERNQYDALLYDDVAAVLMRDDFFLDRFSPTQDTYQTASDDRILGRAYLMQDSFHYGDILPNARKSGYLFFKKLSARNQKNIVMYKDQEIIFARK